MSETGIDGGAWPAVRGNEVNSRTSRVPLSGKGHERWRARLPHRHASGVLVGENGLCFVTTASGILALDGSDVKWSVDDASAWSCLLLAGGLLVTREGEGLVVRDQRTGSTVCTIDGTTLSDPMPLSNGTLAVLASRDDEPVLRAVTVTGQVQWEVELDDFSYQPVVSGDRVIVPEGKVIRAFDKNGAPQWSTGPHGEVHGPPVGLPSGNVLLPILASSVMGYLVIDPHTGDVRPVPAHLRPGAPVVPLRDPETGRELLVLQGWSDTGDHGDEQHTVTVVDIATGDTVLRHRVPSAVTSMAAGPTGLVAVAGSPSWERWSKYHGWPGYNLRNDCYLLFLDKDGIHARWEPRKPITGPLAVGADGEVLVPVAGELVCVE